MLKFHINFKKCIKNLFLTKSLPRNKGWQFEDVLWTDVFEGREVLISEDIDSLSVTSFSFIWSLEMGKCHAMPRIVGLFTIFIFLIRFSLAPSMKLKPVMAECFFWINSVIDVLSGHFLLFLISAIAFIIWSEKISVLSSNASIISVLSLEIHLGDNNKTIQNLNKLIMLVG